MSGILLLSLLLQNSKQCIFATVLFVSTAACFGFSIPPERKLAVNTAIEKMISCDYDGAFTLCDSMIRLDPGDPMAWMLKLSAIGLHDLDLDSATDSLNFFDAYRKADAAVFGYEVKNGVSSYSLTIKGFSKAIAAAYYIWRKKYISGLDLGLKALSVLREAKRRDNSNVDVDFFLGLYTYARADLKHTFWWAFFWYSGDKSAGIRSITGCQRNSQFTRIPAAFLLGEIYTREKQFCQSDTIISGLGRLYPESRMVLWAKAKRDEATMSYACAGSSYQKLAEIYQGIPRARKNTLLTLSSAARMYFSAGANRQAEAACKKILVQKNGYCDDLCRRTCADAEKLLAKLDVQK